MNLKVSDSLSLISDLLSDDEKEKIHLQDCKSVKKSEQKVESHISCILNVVNSLNSNTPK